MSIQGQKVKKVEPLKRQTNKACACGAVYEGLLVSYDRGEHWIDLRKSCPKCRGKAIEEFNAQEAAIKARQLADLRQQWLEKSGIPILFKNKTFDNFESSYQKRAFNICRNYAAGLTVDNCRGYYSLVLISEKMWGVGKTHLVCAIAKEVIKKCKGERWAAPVRFITEPDLYQRIQATYDPKYAPVRLENEDSILRALTHAPLLILDDVGKEERTDKRFIQRILFSIIDGRYRNMLPLIMTTNLNSNALREHLGGEGENEASFDRLLEMCRGKFTMLSGDSYRRKMR